MALTIGGRRRKRPGGGPPATPLSPLEQRLVRRLVTVMNLLASSVDTDAYAAAIRDLDPDLLEQLLAGIDVQAFEPLMEDVLRSVVLEGGTAEARKVIREAPRIGQNPFTGLEYTGRTLPSGIIMPGPTLPEMPDVEFVLEDPVDRMFRFVDQKATDYARTRSGQLVRAINDSNRLAIREVITKAFTGPRTVDQTARSLRQIVGLHPRWARAAENFHEKNYTRLIREGMSPDQAAATADSMTEKYRGKLIRRRAEMIARTEIQQAQNFGREASWVASDKAGLIDPRAEKEWLTAPSSSRYGPPCPICAELRGKRVPWNGTFANGHSMPPAHPNCRCTAAIVPPTRGLTGLPSQDMQSWIDRLDALEAGDAAELTVLNKHLQGQHNQQSHAGGRGETKILMVDGGSIQYGDYYVHGIFDDGNLQEAKSKFLDWSGNWATRTVSARVMGIEHGYTPLPNNTFSAVQRQALRSGKGDTSDFEVQQEIRRASALLVASSGSDTAGQTMHRGIQMKTDDPRYNAKPGDEFETPLSAFSNSPETAVNFARTSDFSEARGRASVILRVSGESRGVGTGNFMGKEFLMQGRFRIDSVEDTTEVDSSGSNLNVRVINLKHVAYYDVMAGKYVGLND